MKGICLPLLFSSSPKQGIVCVPLKWKINISHYLRLQHVYTIHTIHLIIFYWNEFSRKYCLFFVLCESMSFSIVCQHGYAIQVSSSDHEKYIDWMVIQLDSVSVMRQQQEPFWLISHNRNSKSIIRKLSRSLHSYWKTGLLSLICVLLSTDGSVYLSFSLHPHSHTDVSW